MQADRNCIKETLCSRPQVKRYWHYARGDLPLASFLQTRRPGQCPRCGEHSTSHIHTVLHGGQRLSLSVFRQPNPKAREDPAIWLWTRIKVSVT